MDNPITLYEKGRMVMPKSKKRKKRPQPKVTVLSMSDVQAVVKGTLYVCGNILRREFNWPDSQVNLLYDKARVDIEKMLNPQDIATKQPKKEDLAETEG